MGRVTALARAFGGAPCGTRVVLRGACRSAVKESVDRRCGGPLDDARYVHHLFHGQRSARLRGRYGREAGAAANLRPPAAARDPGTSGSPPAPAAGTTRAPAAPAPRR